MEGSRHPGGSALRSTDVASGALLDEMFVDKARPGHPKVVFQREQEMGEKLGNIIAGEIVPRLMLLHRTQAYTRTSDNPLRPDDLSGQIADFAELVVRHDIDVVEAYVRSLLQRGLDLETVLLHLLAPAARRLGQLWDADEITFIDVTVGTSRLQQLLHTFTLALREPEEAPERRVLFLPAPGDQHSFGLTMVMEFFRREGWQVDGGMPMEPGELEACVAEQNFGLIGFSLSCDRFINPLCSAIESVRRLSKNPSLLVMVGGRMFAQDASLRPWVGADLVATDAHEALELAEGALRKIALGRGLSHL
jgi:MerR family transcriptional regulator, light-induced transcriptional regulator